MIGEIRPVEVSAARWAEREAAVLRPRTKPLRLDEGRVALGWLAPFQSHLERLLPGAAAEGCPLLLDYWPRRRQPCWQSSIQSLVSATGSSNINVRNAASDRCIPQQLRSLYPSGLLLMVGWSGVPEDVGCQNGMSYGKRQKVRPGA